MSKWQSVADTLPRYDQRVLISMRHKNYPKNDHIGLARRVKTDANGEWWTYDSNTVEFQGVTFWHPLPEAPQLPDNGGCSNADR